MNLSTIEEIERAIAALTPEQREELCDWLDEQYSQPGETKLRARIEAGQFDDRISRALADHKSGRTTPL